MKVTVTDLMMLIESLGYQIHKYEDFSERARAKGYTISADAYDDYIIKMNELRDRLIAYIKR